MKNEVSMAKLQNGSDIRGVAVEGVADEPVTLTPAAVNRIAAAFVVFLTKKTGKSAAELKIAVGHDSRISAATLKEAVLQALTASGASVYDCALASTPAMFMSLVYPETDFDGSIMLTASHLPYNRNGMKFFDKDGGLEKSNIAAILQCAEGLDTVTADLSGVKRFDLISLYAEKLCQKIRDSVQAENYAQPLLGMHIVVDAGNGGGGFFVDKVLNPLGADTSGSLFLEPDGRFPNHVPNPEDKKAMAALCQGVRDAKADLGLIFDTDVDRMSAALSDARPINKDALIAMMAAIVAPECPQGTIVTDSVTSDKLTEFLETHLKLKHHRYQRGYKNVIDECRRLNENNTPSPLAIETSGHGALRENYYLDDGAYLAVKLLIAAAKAKREGRNLADLIAPLKPQFECREYRMKLKAAEFAAYGKQVLQTFEERALQEGIHVVKPSYEGVRLSFGAMGWALLRLSLHDPVMPLNIEGGQAGDCEKILRTVLNLLRDLPELDTSACR